MAGSGVQTLWKETQSAVTATKPTGIDLGTERWEGGRKYVYVYNGDEQIAPTYGCVLKSGATNYTVTITSIASQAACFGIVREATITTGTYGWVMKRGITTFEGGTESFSNRMGLIMGAAGVFENASFHTNLSTLVNALNIAGYSLVSMATGGSGLGYFNCL